MTEADLRMMFDLNVMGTVFAMQAAVPHLRAAGGGTIVNEFGDGSAPPRIPCMAGYSATRCAGAPIERRA
ncbi:SDR family NAD(P)-dependent oxidoreductase [Sphingomonas sp. MMS24-JH45]